ncbi:ATP-NAD kinase-like domain-containing protein [Collybia nuda]|uniref:ATP-NAD kinase-like domain-containing protein n=1 Tax=Collybia nuda TaxID=64659 RepID=A0A9P5YE92_9AGAR|nr:ATP-NAD kinase-like domain-containing protein [Collybia nuda]
MEPIRPSLSRRSSRPTSLHINQAEWASDIVLEAGSPNISKKPNATLSPPSVTQDRTTTPRSSAIEVSSPPQEDSRPIHDPRKAMDSPCFVHSHLDKGASLTDWLRNKQHALIGGTDVGVAKSLQQKHSGIPQQTYSPSTLSSASSSLVASDEDEDDFGGSLTKQLAETAVGVREMSKQLGRARVQSNIQNVLIVTKARDNRLIKLTRELAVYLMMKPQRGSKRGLVVYVDNQLRHSRRFDAEGIERDHPELFVPFPRRRTSSSNSVSSLSSLDREEQYLKDEGQLRYWTSSMCSHSPHLFDFVVTLGGDGTVLFTSWLFQRIVPPVLPFALGSLGFLTNFDFADHQAVMDSAIDSGIRVNLRMRFTCTVYRAVVNEKGKGRKAVKKGETGEIMMKNVEKGGWEALEGGWSGGYSTGDPKPNTKDKEIMCFTTRPVETFEVLNDLVVDRGPSPYVSLLELFGDEHHMTTVQADGLTVSTPTGSTAYSLSAGGSLVHPEIPALLITPICPHTLSFRPMLLPDSMELRICVPYNSRSTAWASFDGRGRVELKQGDHIKVTASKYPFPTVCADKQSTDWFHSISRTLKWNERERQKSFVVVEEDPAKPKKNKRMSVTQDRGKVSAPIDEMVDEEDEVSDEDDDDEEEEDVFDIDDSSPEAANLKPANINNNLTRREEVLGQEKAADVMLENALRKVVAESALRKGRRKSKSRSRSRSGLRSGVDSPSRFARPPQGPTSPRHVEFDLGSSSPPDISETETLDPQRGSRDDIHSHRISSSRSRIPKDRDDIENIKTPTASSLMYGRTRGQIRSRSADHHGRRAFAVWGHDESDSNTSDGST